MNHLSSEEDIQMISTYGKGRSTMLAVLTLVLVVAGCTTTQSPGRQVDDNAIHAAVTAKLTGAKFSNLLNVDVNVTNGVVTLAGEVPNAQVKAEAEQEARNVSGVTRVINNLQVKAPPSR
jgi:osmotically-inducible protein OsmY